LFSPTIYSLTTQPQHNNSPSPIYIASKVAVLYSSIEYTMRLLNKDTPCIAVVYVDDSFFTGPDKALNQQLEDAFMKKWECQDLGELTYQLSCLNMVAMTARNALAPSEARQWGNLWFCSQVFSK
jgi:hypothetical protein